MFDNWQIDNKPVLNPIDTDRLKIDLVFKKGTIAESQPVLSFDKLILSNSGKDAYLCARKKYGAYQEIEVKYSFSNREIFSGYLTNPEFKLETDQIEVKPVSFNSTDGLTEKLSAIESSLLEKDYRYTPLDFIIEKVDIKDDLIQLGLSSLLYGYILYTQIKELARLLGRAIEATINATPPGLSFGSAIALALEIVAQIAFVASTIAQLIDFAKQAKELIIPKKRTTNVITLFELCRAPLAKIGYELVTDIDDMKLDAIWSSGNVNIPRFFPRSLDRCGNAIGCINFAIEKYNARVFVKNKTVYIVNYYSPLFFNSSGLVLQDYPRGDYTENLDDMVGTREHIYSVDYNDDWTLENFKGTEYKIRANISDPTKSTIKGISQKNYGVALCNRKESLNEAEKAFKKFATFVNDTIAQFGGSSQILSLPNRIGCAKISSDNLGVAKIVRLSGRKIATNHRDVLSAKSDEEKYHWIESHVRNPRAKKRVYKDILQKYDDKLLSCNLDNNIVFTPEGIAGELKNLEWEKGYDNALMTFEIEDVDREIRLTETFSEPEK